MPIRLMLALGIPRRQGEPPPLSSSAIRRERYAMRTAIATSRQFQQHASSEQTLSTIPTKTPGDSVADIHPTTQCRLKPMPSYFAKSLLHKSEISAPTPILPPELFAFASSSGDFHPASPLGRESASRSRGSDTATRRMRSDSSVAF